MQNNSIDLSSVKIRKPLIMVPDFSAVNEGKSEVLLDFLKKLKAEGEILIITDTKDIARIKKAAEGLKNVKAAEIREVVSKDILAADCIVASESAVSEASERLSK